MSQPTKFPSARQPAVYQDESGDWLFTRVWFLFLQAQYLRSGGTIAPVTPDAAAVDNLAPIDGAGPDMEYMLRTMIQGLDQGPHRDVYSGFPVDDVAPAVAGLQDQINDLRTMITSLQQGTTIL